MFRQIFLSVVLAVVGSLLLCTPKVATTPQNNQLYAFDQAADPNSPQYGFQQIQQDPTKFTGTAVTWSGVINDLSITSEGSALTITQIPLNALNSTYPLKYSEGRFIAKTHKKLSADIYKTGMTIALDAKVDGIITKPLGNSRYTYPVVNVQTIYYCTAQCADPLAYNCKKGAGWMGINSWRCQDDQDTGERKQEQIE